MKDRNVSCCKFRLPNKNISQVLILASVCPAKWNGRDLRHSLFSKAILTQIVSLYANAARASVSVWTYNYFTTKKTAWKQISHTLQNFTFWGFVKSPYNSFERNRLNSLIQKSTLPFHWILSHLCCIIIHLTSLCVLKLFILLTDLKSLWFAWCTIHNQ